MTNSVGWAKVVCITMANSGGWASVFCPRGGFKSPRENFSPNRLKEILILSLSGPTSLNRAMRCGDPSPSYTVHTSSYSGWYDS